MSNIEIKVPDIGGSTDVSVAEVYVKVGDVIKKDDNLIMLETDKATVDVPSTHDGRVIDILVKAGSKVNEGSVILKLENLDLAINSDKTISSDKISDKNAATLNKIPDKMTKVDAIQADELQCDVLVIGAGPGGYTAAFRAADLGLKVILIEKYASLGGVCLNVGCIPSKALLHVARVINEADEMSQHGIEFNKPTLNLDKIRDYKNGVVKKLTTGLTGLAKQRKVEVILGVAKFTSPHTVEVVSETLVSATPESKTQAPNAQVIRFESAIIAAGSSVFKVPGFPFDDPRIISSTGALRLDDIPKAMLVVGGGIIGLEMAEVYSTLGSQVTVVELSDGLITGCDRDLVKVLETRIKKRYAAIYTKTKCAKVEAKKDAIYVTFAGDGVPDEPQKFDKVLVAAGRRPNGLNLGAELAGVKVNDNGYIPVDKACRTNIAHIYAIGDIVGQPMLAHKATHEGRVAAENCAGLKAYFDARVIPGVAYTDPEIAWVGVTELDARTQGLEIEVGKFPWAASGRALGNGRDDGFTKIIADAKTHKIIGAGIVGVNAGELLAETGLAIEMGCDIHDVALTIHAHPTLSESVAFACEMIDGSITDLYVPKKKK
jgi:dihydrolipoamide dehydrogenase